MAFEFKKLSDVNVIESVSETTNVLVEENGEIVKTELETAVRSFELPYIQFTRLQDTLTISIRNDNHRNIETTELMELMEKYSLPYSHFEFYDMGEAYDPMAPHPTYACKKVLNNVVNFGGNMYGARTFTFNFGDEVPHIIFDALANTIVLDPDWVAPAEPIPAPVTAEVGQVVAVKAVDENGKPTEWEAVDMSAGSGLTDFLIYFDEAGDGTKTWHANMTGVQLVSLINNKTLGNMIVRRYCQYENEYYLYELNGKHTYFAYSDTDIVQFIIQDSDYDYEEYYIQLNADGTLQEWTPPD